MGSIDFTENNFETNTNTSNNDHGWQKVTYTKRHTKQKPVADSGFGKTLPNSGDTVFRSLEKQSEDRRRRILEAQTAAADADSDGVDPARSKRRSNGYGDVDYSDSDSEAGKENQKVEEVKKIKPKKPKKPKVTVAEAAGKIKADDLSAFLAEILKLYEDQVDIQLMRFADYFGRAFSGVSSAQFPWVKMFKETALAKVVDIPLSHIADDVYKTSVSWINKCPLPALSTFVLWSLDSILTDLASQHAGVKGTKKAVKHASSKSQVAIFVVLAMVLRCKPDALTFIIPTLRENSKYAGQDKLPLLVWMMAQGSQGDIAVGLYSWAHYLLPIVSSKSCNPLSRDLILQLVERMLSNSKARTILVNGAVRRGERLIPPSSLEILMRVTFPVTSARVKATERFEALYPTLKDVALAGSPGSKAMKQVSQQIFSFAIKTAGESSPELSKEASGIVIWCLTQNAECCKQWDKVYEENVEASVSVLKKLLEEWKEQSLKLAPYETLKETLKSFRRKNEEAIADGANAAHQGLYKDADKYCKLILGRLSRGAACMKSVAIVAIVMGLSIAFLPPNIMETVESFDWKKVQPNIMETVESFDWKKLQPNIMETVESFDWKKLPVLDSIYQAYWK